MTRSGFEDRSVAHEWFPPAFWTLREALALSTAPDLPKRKKASIASASAVYKQSVVFYAFPPHR